MQNAVSSGVRDVSEGGHGMKHQEVTIQPLIELIEV